VVTIQTSETGHLSQFRRRRHEGGLHRKATYVPSVGQTSAASVATVVLGAVAGVIAGRALGPHGRGVYAIATVAPTFIGVAGTLGVEEAIVFVAGRAHGLRRTGQLIWGSLFIALVLGSIASAASIAFQLLFFWSPALGVSKVLFIAFACQPLQYALAQCSVAHLRAQSRYTGWNILRVVVPSVYLSGLVLFLALGALTVNAAILCLLTGNIAVVIASTLSVCLSNRPSTSRAEIENLLSLGWKNHLITMQTYANQQLDQVFLAAMVPAAQLGGYTIAVTYASAGFSLGQAPALQMYSYFSRQANPDRAAYRRLLARTMLLLTGISFVSAVSAPFLIPLLFGKSYEMAVVPALVLIFSAPLLSLGAMFSAIWKSAGKPLAAAKGQGIGLLLTVVTLPAAIICFGIDGAAIVSIVVYAVVAVWLWRSCPFEGLRAARVAPELPVSVTKEAKVSSE
jgi:O-antigen/teichoic acid export membrane protein